MSKQLTRVAVGLSAFALASSVLATPRTAAFPVPATGRASHATQIVLLALDGVRYEEVFGGVDPELGKQQQLPESGVVSGRQLMPNLHALMSEHGRPSARQASAFRSPPAAPNTCRYLGIPRCSLAGA